MYERGCAALAAGCGITLPITGGSVTWVLIGGVTILLAGIALLRLLPRRQRVK